MVVLFRRLIISILLIILIIVMATNFYFIKMIISTPKLNMERTLLTKSSSSKIRTSLKSSNMTSKIRNTRLMEKEIIKEIRRLPSQYFKQNANYSHLLENLLLELKVIEETNKNILNVLKDWPNAQHLIPYRAPELGTVIELLRKEKVVKADTAKMGTQLKVMLTFENGLKAVFKPQWYSRTMKMNGPVYYGRDRHNAEVVAFYLASLLSFRRVPLALIRKLKLTEEIRNVATPELSATVYKQNDNTCFYGVCYYCTPKDFICGTNDILEGTIILWLPPEWNLIKYRHPWQRTYTKNRLALWEIDMDFCNKVKESEIYAPQSSNRLLNLIDTAIFDYLIDNGDRHHYEILKGNFTNPAILLIDNGKSLGNPDVDHIDILAPLYQCCMIRKTTWKRLQLLRGGSLSYSLEKLLAHESLMADVLPLTTHEHLQAIDRRLLTVFAVMERCLKNNQHSSNVIVDK